MKIVCPNCGEDINVKAVKAAGNLCCKSCGERFKINEKPNSIFLFIVRVVLLILLFLMLWAVTKVTFMPKWIYVILVLALTLALALGSIYLLNFFTVYKLNRRVKRELRLRNKASS